MKGLKHPATLIAALALFAALSGGVAVASGLISGTQIKNHTIAEKKLTKSAIAALRGQRGAQGPKGSAGPPGPVTTTLPSGDTLRGEFLLDGESHYLGGTISFGGYVLSAAPTPSGVNIGGSSTSSCPGSAANPQAAGGKLCFYLTLRSNVSTTGFYSLGPGLTSEDYTGTDGKADPFGAVLYAQSTCTCRAYVGGSWAVTAP